MHAVISALILARWKSAFSTAEAIVETAESRERALNLKQVLLPEN
jgi:hypothetical protein